MQAVTPPYQWQRQRNGRHLKWKSSGNKDMHIFLPCCVDFPFTFYVPPAYFNHICLSSEMHATTATTTTAATCRWATCCSLTAVKKKTSCFRCSNTTPKLIAMLPGQIKIKKRTLFAINFNAKAAKAQQINR